MAADISVFGHLTQGNLDSGRHGMPHSWPHGLEILSWDLTPAGGTLHVIHQSWFGAGRLMTVIRGVPKAAARASVRAGSDEFCNRAEHVDNLQRLELEETMWVNHAVFFSRLNGKNTCNQTLGLQQPASRLVPSKPTLWWYLHLAL